MRYARQLTALATAALALSHCSAPFSSAPPTGDMADASGGAAAMNPPIIIPVVGADAGDSTTSPDDGSVESSIDASVDASIDGASEASMCAAPLPLDCNGVCVDPTLPSHCGSCSNVCPGPEAGEGHAICASGACAVACDTESSTSLDCNGACVDPTDVTHCGSCSNACAGPSSSKNGHAVCLSPSGGGMPACNIQCDARYHQCNGDCLADTDTPSVASDPCILTEAFGVFVASTGSDAMGIDGSRAHPYGTIGHAMDKAAKAGTSPLPRVYVCASAGKFTAERLLVNRSRQGVNVFGGLDCSAPTNVWTYDASKKATLAPSAQGYAMKIQDSTGNTFEDFAFVSNAGMSAGESSIAVFATGAQNIVFRRSDFLAGMGKVGASAMPAPARLSMDAPMGHPTIPDPATGGWIPAASTVNPACPTSIGGAGGCVATSLLDGAPGQPGPRNGGFRVNCMAATQGVNGQYGAQGFGAVTWATFTAAGWAPLAGGAGGDGQVGQGGGGGAGPVADSAYPDFCAGAGGAGGCGGAGGGGGGGGGSSIAALLYASGADFEACVLRTSDGGRGGDGVFGQIGQAGGAGGFSAATGDGTTCAAPGPGGRGGSGGQGAGGAGGLSVGIVWHGASAMAPVIDGNSVPVAVSLPNAWTSGLPGMGGQGQDPFTPTLKGKDGVSQPVLQIP